MADTFKYEALGFSGEDVDSISVAIDESNNLTVTANLKDGTKKSSEPVALPTGGSGGGTQLYRHTLVSSKITIDAISTNSIAATTQSDAIAIINNSIIAKDTAKSIILFVEAETNTVYYIDSTTANLGSVSFSLMDDTVTPL